MRDLLSGTDVAEQATCAWSETERKSSEWAEAERRCRVAKAMRVPQSRSYGQKRAT